MRIVIICALDSSRRTQTRAHKKRMERNSAHRAGERLARATRALASMLAAAALVACGGGGSGGGSTASAQPSASSASLSDAAQIGALIFNDASLSASGRMSCATCHDPQLGHASPFATPVAFGGANLDQGGLRNPPSLRYLRFNGSFAVSADGTPTGGF